MFNCKLFLQTVTIVVVALSGASQVSAVCGLGGEIGFGTTSSGGSVIVANDCGVIDSKSGGICGSYNQGSDTICNSDSQVVSAQTSDGRDWSKCVGSTETCGSTQISFCCS